MRIAGNLFDIEIPEGAAQADGMTPRLLREMRATEGASNLWKFRKLINKQFLEGWWQYVVTHELMRFYNRWVAGKRPKLILMSPPQLGKSTQIIDFIAWLVGQRPNTRTIFASYSDRLGLRANLRLQRLLTSEIYQTIFPAPRLPMIGDRRSPYQRNTNILEYLDQEGSFRNTTVNGPITGESLDVGVIDDPIKGRAEASSQLIRDKTWEWFTDDFFTRFSQDAAMVMILTRWHVDDPAGRLIEYFGDQVRVLRYPAIATEDEMYRRKGEALFPELKNLDFLMERRRLLTLSGWEAIYQQNPIIVGGGVFPIEKFRILPVMPHSLVAASVRYWDKAGTDRRDNDKAKYTAGVLMHALTDGRFVIEDVRRGQFAFAEREDLIKQTAQLDGYGVSVVVEQEPGSGGKESAERTIQNLSGWTVTADRVTGAKEVRAEPYASQQQVGNISLVKGEWNKSFIDEHEQFPSGPYKDQVDAAAGAFMNLTDSWYDASQSWIGAAEVEMPRIIVPG